MNSISRSRILASFLLALGGVTLSPAMPSASAQSGPGEIFVDLDPNTSYPPSRCITVEKSGVGRARVCATATSQGVSFVIERLTTAFNGTVRIAGLLQCGSQVQKKYDWNTNPQPRDSRALNCASSSSTVASWSQVSAQ